VYFNLKVCGYELIEVPLRNNAETFNVFDERARLPHAKNLATLGKQIEIWLTRRSALVSIKLRALLIIATFKKAITRGAQHINVDMEIYRAPLLTLGDTD
jgi:hypothetical protein